MFFAGCKHEKIKFVYSQDNHVWIKDRHRVSKIGFMTVMYK